MASKLWQQPYVNVFKHFKVDEWKRAAKEGDVSAVVDKTLKATVYRITGAVPAANYVKLPSSPAHSLGLTGRFLYLLFKPVPNKFFVVHLDVCTQEGLVIRVSFSNLFKEFTSTNTWLQFPFLCGGAKGSVHERTAAANKQADDRGPAPGNVRWTCLMLDLHHVLSCYLSQCYSHVKSVKLCSCMMVRNIFTSDAVYQPGLTFAEAKLSGLMSQGFVAMPREMAFPVPKDSSWHEFYDYIRFPSNGKRLPFDSIQKGQAGPSETAPAQMSPARNVPRTVNASKSGHERVSIIQQTTAPRKQPNKSRLVVLSLPEVHLRTPTDGISRAHGGENTGRAGDGEGSRGGNDGQNSGVDSSPHEAKALGDDGGIHVYAHRAGGGNSRPAEMLSREVPEAVDLIGTPVIKHKTLQSEPLLKLRRVVGFGGETNGYALWTRNGATLVYPCHAVIVALDVETSSQHFLTGHSDKVSALAFDGNTEILASGQSGPQAIVRIWNFQKGSCLAMFKTHAHSLFSLSFSWSGDVLSGVGRDSHGKTMVVVWDTSGVTHRRDVLILAKAHTGVDVQTMVISPFDESRLVSCGRDNVRVWRLQNGSLRSCAVDLGDLHSTEVTDVAFQERSPALDDKRLFACTRSGHILDIDYKHNVVREVTRLRQPPSRSPRERLPDQGFELALTRLAVSRWFCVTGSEDGTVRVWSPDFSRVLLQTDLGGAVSLLGVSADGRHVLAGTRTGHLARLDVGGRSYATVTRSPVGPLLDFSLDLERQRVAAVSTNGSLTIWDLGTGQQLYEFSGAEDSACTVSCHPQLERFACGFSSGSVRVFDVVGARLLAQHRQHRGEITGLEFSPNGEHMYSCDARGSLALYSAICKEHTLVRLLSGVVARGTSYAPSALAVSGDGAHLAFVGPSEFAVTVADARSLCELLRVDVSIVDASSPTLDQAERVCFGPAGQLLVATASGKVLWFDARTGRLLKEVRDVQGAGCSALQVSEDGAIVAMASDATLRAWDPGSGLEVQAFVGHSQEVRRLRFTGRCPGLVSGGGTIFMWDLAGYESESTAKTGGRTDHPLPMWSPGDRVGFAMGESGARGGDSQPHMAIPSSPHRLDMTGISPLAHTGDSPGRVREGTGLGGRSDRAVVIEDNIPSRRDISSLLQAREKCDDQEVNIMERVTDVDEHMAVPCAQPKSYRHFVPHLKTSAPSKRRRGATGGALLRLSMVVGFNGNARGNVIWNPDSGLFAYTCGSLLVLEDLHTGAQRHLQAHTEEISTLASSHDAEVLASASGGRGDTGSQICVWDARRGSCERVLSRHRHEVQAMAFSADNSVLLSVGDYREMMVVLWDTRTYAVIAATRSVFPINDVCPDPSAAGAFLCVGSGAIAFCRAQNLGETAVLQLSAAPLPNGAGASELSAAVMGPDSLLFTASACGRVAAWDADRRRCLLSWDADTADIGVLCCHGNRLLSGSSSKRIRLWCVESVSATMEGGVRESEFVSMEGEMVLDGAVVSAAFDDVMEMGIVGTAAGTLWYINWTERACVRLVSGHRGKVNDIAFSPDGSQLVSGSEDGLLRVWSVPEMELVVQFQVLHRSCTCVAWRPSGAAPSQVAAGFGDGTLRLFGVASARTLHKLQPHGAAIRCVAFSSDGEVMLTGGADGRVALNSVSTGLTFRMLSQHSSSPICSLQCAPAHGSPEGRDLWLAASLDRRISIWKADWPKDECNLVDWLTFQSPCEQQEEKPSGRLPRCSVLICPSEPTTVVHTGFDLETDVVFYSLTLRQVTRRIPVLGHTTCLSLAPSGDHLAIGSTERALMLTAPEGGTLRDAGTHSDEPHVIRFSPSGSVLGSAAHNEIFVWRLLR
uniref:WD repeat-containing protein 90-like isoform X2 n=1 Tax=Petromyzon marinus TaxID=7757 RepID=A0AAJ7X9M9_PETMA|nr:WD repeat-containing protein 90-like isoform X2 [Petromyzon marinus]